MKKFILLFLLVLLFSAFVLCDQQQVNSSFYFINLLQIFFQVKNEQPKKNTEISDNDDDDQEEEINELENYKAPKPEGSTVFFENFNEDPFTSKRWIVSTHPKYSGNYFLLINKKYFRSNKMVWSN